LKLGSITYLCFFQDITALKNERLAAIKQAYQEKHKDRDRRFKKELSPSFNNANDRRESSSPDGVLQVGI